MNFQSQQTANVEMTVALKSRVHQDWKLYDIRSAVVTLTLNNEGLQKFTYQSGCGIGCNMILIELEFGEILDSCVKN